MNEQCHDSTSSLKALRLFHERYFPAYDIIGEVSTLSDDVWTFKRSFVMHPAGLPEVDEGRVR
jgi:hypothetical protein